MTLRVCVAVFWGSYFDHALAWEKRMDDPNVKIVTYEEMKEVDFPSGGSVSSDRHSVWSFSRRSFCPLKTFCFPSCRT